MVLFSPLFTIEVYLTKKKRPHNVAQVAMVLLFRDVFWLYLGFLIICIIERNRLEEGSFTIFRILFEVVSAYGTVGLSLGFPNFIPRYC